MNRLAELFLLMVLYMSEKIRRKQQQKAHYFYRFTLLTACPHGYFGLDCLHKCNTYCSGNGSCSRFTGVCDEGCKDEWMGSKCRTRINTGMS